MSGFSIFVICVIRHFICGDSSKQIGFGLNCIMIKLCFSLNATRIYSDQEWVWIQQRDVRYLYLKLSTSVPSFLSPTYTEEKSGLFTGREDTFPSWFPSRYFSIVLLPTTWFPGAILHAGAHIDFFHEELRFLHVRHKVLLLG